MSRVFVSRIAGEDVDTLRPPAGRIFAITEYSSPFDAHEVELTLAEAMTVYRDLGQLLKAEGRA